MAAQLAPQSRSPLFRGIRSLKSTALQLSQRNNGRLLMNLKSSRRGFFGTLGTIVAAIAAPRKLFSARVAAPQSAASVNGFGQTGNPYTELGVTPVINAEGTMTMLGGSLIRPEVEAVMAQAARHFINIPELEVAAGKRIAQMLKLPQEIGRASCRERV